MDDSLPQPLVSVIVLTRNEEANIDDALRSLLAQEEARLEVLVVDSASGDATVEIAQRHARAHPDHVRVLTCDDIPIGPARNLGIEHARGEVIAFLSADAMAAPGWAREMVASLREADVVYGRQEHAPSRHTVSAAVRGLRYHHFDSDDDAPPDTFASNVNAAIRRSVFDRLRYVHDGPASALDDILFTREAMALGFRVAYNARMLVRHKDATSLRGEFIKNRREGYGWGLLAPQLGVNRAALAWAMGLAAIAGGVIALPVPPTLGLVGLLLGIYAPTLRRVLRGGRRLAREAPGPLAMAALASPVFDLAWLFHYFLGLKDRRPELTGILSG